MAGGWKLLVDICLPVPFVLLVLLTLPAPKAFNRSILTLVDRTLGVRFVGLFSLLHVMLVVTGVALLATVKATMEVTSERKNFASDETPNVVANHLAKKWRGERNFWISFICFVLWCLLARLHQIMVHKAQLEDRLKALEGPGPATKPTSMPPPASGSAPKKVA
ncbi:hypothetical protein WJX84_007779 [Apatococcus fuscideae]|uniref:BAP29/BAP31 transmembrane domain-containing protein n=1 Tax=Apatococcus fuscideae TaxID=2026836 RepID=A0AAW1TGF7_9CHLO